MPNLLVCLMPCLKSSLPQWFAGAGLAVSFFSGQGVWDPDTRSEAISNHITEMPEGLACHLGSTLLSNNFFSDADFGYLSSQRKFMIGTSFVAQRDALLRLANLKLTGSLPVGQTDIKDTRKSATPNQPA